MSQAGIALTLLLTIWMISREPAQRPGKADKAQGGHTQHLIGPTVLRSVLGLVGVRAAAEAVIGQVSGVNVSGLVCRMPHQVFVAGRCVQVAVLVRFDQARYGTEDSATSDGITFLPSTKDKPASTDGQPDSSIEIVPIPGWKDSPRFSKPTFRAGLAGVAFGSTCAMLLIPERQATIVWAYSGAVGYLISVAASLTVQGRWQEFWEYEERNFGSTGKVEEKPGAKSDVGPCRPS